MKYSKKLFLSLCCKNSKENKNYKKILCGISRLIFFCLFLHNIFCVYGNNISDLYDNKIENLNYSKSVFHNSFENNIKELIKNSNETAEEIEEKIRQEFSKVGKVEDIDERKGNAIIFNGTRRNASEEINRLHDYEDRSKDEGEKERKEDDRRRALDVLVVDKELDSEGEEIEENDFNMIRDLDEKLFESQRDGVRLDFKEHSEEKNVKLNSKRKKRRKDAKSKEESKKKRVALLVEEFYKEKKRLENDIVALEKVFVPLSVFDELQKMLSINLNYKPNFNRIYYLLHTILSIESRNKKSKKRAQWRTLKRKSFFETNHTSFDSPKSSSFGGKEDFKDQKSPQLYKGAYPHIYEEYSLQILEENQAAGKAVNNKYQEDLLLKKTYKSISKSILQKIQGSAWEVLVYLYTFGVPDIKGRLDFPGGWPRNIDAAISSIIGGIKNKNCSFCFTMSGFLISLGYPPFVSNTKAWTVNQSHFLFNGLSKNSSDIKKSNLKDNAAHIDAKDSSDGMRSDKIYSEKSLYFIFASPEMYAAPSLSSKQLFHPSEEGSRDLFFLSYSLSERSGDLLGGLIYSYYLRYNLVSLDPNVNTPLVHSHSALHRTPNDAGEQCMYTLDNIIKAAASVIKDGINLPGLKIIQTAENLNDVYDMNGGKDKNSYYKNEDERKEYVHFVQNLANERRVEALTALGELYYHGHDADIGHDINRAAELWHEAAVLGDPEAALSKAFLHIDKQVGNVQDAEPYLAQVLDIGDPQASAFAGYYLNKLGLGTPKNETKAGEYLILAAQLGDPNAQLLLAHAYAGNEDVVGAKIPGTGDLQLALHYYKLAASAGRLVGFYNAGILTLQGYDKDVQTPLRKCVVAYDYFKRVAENNYLSSIIGNEGFRAYKLGDITGSVLRYMFLSETGNEVAHLNAYYLYKLFLTERYFPLHNADWIDENTYNDSLAAKEKMNVDEEKDFPSDKNANDTKNSDVGWRKEFLHIIKKYFHVFFGFSSGKVGKEKTEKEEFNLVNVNNESQPKRLYAYIIDSIDYITNSANSIIQNVFYFIWKKILLLYTYVSSYMCNDNHNNKDNILNNNKHFNKPPQKYYFEKIKKKHKFTKEEIDDIRVSEYLRCWSKSEKYYHSLYLQKKYLNNNSIYSSFLEEKNNHTLHSYNDQETCPYNKNMYLDLHSAAYFSSNATNDYYNQNKINKNKKLKKIEEIIENITKEKNDIVYSNMCPFYFLKRAAFSYDSQHTYKMLFKYRHAELGSWFSNKKILQILIKKFRHGDMRSAFEIATFFQEKKSTKLDRILFYNENLAQHIYLDILNGKTAHIEKRIKKSLYNKIKKYSLQKYFSFTSFFNILSPLPHPFRIQDPYFSFIDKFCAFIQLLKAAMISAFRFFNIHRLFDVLSFYSIDEQVDKDYVDNKEGHEAQEEGFSVFDYDDEEVDFEKEDTKLENEEMNEELEEKELFLFYELFKAFLFSCIYTETKERNFYIRLFEIFLLSFCFFSLLIISSILSYGIHTERSLESNEGQQEKKSKEVKEIYKFDNDFVKCENLYDSSNFVQTNSNFNCSVLSNNGAFMEKSTCVNSCSICFYENENNSFPACEPNSIDDNRKKTEEIELNKIEKVSYFEEQQNYKNVDNIPYSSCVDKNICIKIQEEQQASEERMNRAH